MLQGISATTGKPGQRMLGVSGLPRTIRGGISQPFGTGSPFSLSKVINPMGIPERGMIQPDNRQIVKEVGQQIQNAGPARLTPEKGKSLPKSIRF